MATDATSFGTAAADYERGRPGYPADAVAWLLPESPGTVVDVGAGTGKLTAQVAAMGHSVTAVEPDEAMLTTLTAMLPSVPALAGSAEAIPLPDASAAAVVLAQAWHWVDVERASAEVARVLRPGGTLGLVWNLRDDRVPWVRDLGHAMHGSAAESLIDGDGPRVGAPFGELEHATFEWRRQMEADDLRAMVRSRSYYITAGEQQRAAVERSVDAVLSSLPGGGRTLELPYVTHAFRARRP